MDTAMFARYNFPHETLCDFLFVYGAVDNKRKPNVWGRHPQQHWGICRTKHNDGASFGAIGVSWDVVFASICGWYFGAGIGPYMRDSGDKYVESRLVFGERVFIGKNIGDRVRAEIFTLHFSNGDFTHLNHGFNFLGIGVNYSF